MLSQHDPEDNRLISNERRHKVRLDLTINVPTIMTMLIFCGSSIVWGIRVYNDLNERTVRNAYDLAVVVERQRALEATVAQVRAETGVQLQTIRNDIRADLTEIKGDIKSLTFPRRMPAELKEWSK